MQQTQQSWWKQIRAKFFSRRGEFRRDARTSWKVILASFFVGTLAVLAVGYGTYYSATQLEESGEPSSVPRSTLRSGDVKVVIETYQQKQERFTMLLSDRPTFLSPGKGAQSSVKFEESVSSSGSTTSTTVLP